MAVESLAAPDERLYDEFLARHAEATLYHSLRYRDLLLAVAGGEAEYLVARGDGRIVGVLPAIARAGSYGRVINSLPFFGSYGGVLSESAEAAAALWAAFGDRTASAGVAAATVIENPFIDGSAPSATLPATHGDERIAQFTPLEPGPSFRDKLLARIDGSARRNLRKAELAGIRVVVDNDALGFLERAHGEGMAEIGGTPKPAAFFAAIRSLLRPEIDYRVYAAKSGGAPVAALLVFYFGRFAEYITPATAGGHREQQPMAAILFRALSDAAAEGRGFWNWGGTWLSQTGVYRFKRKWGAEERRYGYATILRDPALLRLSAQELSALYPYFYVLPYSSLHAFGTVAS